MPLSSLEKLMLSDSPAQESLLRHLTPRDFLRMRLAGIQITPSLTRNLQSKYLCGFCDDLEAGPHFVNNRQNFDNGNIVHSCTNPQPQTHNYLDEHICRDCFHFSRLHRAPAEAGIIAAAKQRFCPGCVKGLIPDDSEAVIERHECTCRQKWRDNWECYDCWDSYMSVLSYEHLEKKFEPGYIETCGTPGCDRRPGHVKRKFPKDDEDGDEIFVTVEAHRCGICKGVCVSVE